jgi:hypothetical protein
MASRASTHTTIRTLSTAISQRETAMRKADKVANHYGAVVLDSDKGWRQATDKERKEASEKIKRLDGEVRHLKAALAALTYCMDLGLL